MKKITKKAFIAAMTENTIIFFGTMKRLAENDEIKLTLDNFNKALKNGVIVEHRKYTAHSNFLEATGGSRLYFDQRDTEYRFYEYSGVYACVEHNKKYNTENVIYYKVA